MSATIQLTPAQARHLLRLLYEDDASGEYYGNREEYQERTRTLIAKLGGLSTPTHGSAT